MATPNSTPAATSGDDALTPSMQVSPSNTAVVFTDPQIEVLSERGAAWQLVRDSIMENNTIDNMEKLFKAAKDGSYNVFVSPH